MKKYAFIAGVLAIAAALILRAWAAGLGLGAAMLGWIAVETRLRTRFHFLRGTGFSEANFDLGADPAQMELAEDGSCALFATLDGAVAMRDARGRQLWKRPAEPATLAYLALPGGACYYALGDELVRCDASGRVQARLAFAPPPFKQSYRLLLAEDASTLMLHTPWFLQFAEPGLGALGQRISCEECGHYLKYAALSPRSDRAFFAGAKLLEEGQGTEARWGSWKREGGVWVADWAQAQEGYGNSHVRGLAFSRDGSLLLLELYSAGYELRLFHPDGSAHSRRAGAEHPRLSPDASLVLWESALDGLVLADTAARAKQWIRKPKDQLRHKALLPQGECLLLEGRRLLRLDRSGATAWEAWFQNDPYRFASSADGMTLAVLWQSKGALLRLGGR